MILHVYEVQQLRWQDKHKAIVIARHEAIFTPNQGFFGEKDNLPVIASEDVIRMGKANTKRSPLQLKRSNLCIPMQQQVIVIARHEAIYTPNQGFFAEKDNLPVIASEDVIRMGKAKTSDRHCG